MNSIIAFVKKLQLFRVLVIFVAGIFLLINTACSQPSSATTPTSPSRASSIKKSDMSNPGYDPNYQTPTGYKEDDNVVLKAVKESYKTEPRQGGMNEHKDVDRRQDTSASEAKSKELVDRAQGNLQGGIRNAQKSKVVENIREKAAPNQIKGQLENLSDNVSDSSKEIKEGTQRGFKNLKSNLKTASEQASDIIDETTR